MPSWGKSAGGCARRNRRTSATNARSSWPKLKSMAGHCTAKPRSVIGCRERRPTMGTDTAYTLDQFLADTRATIKSKGVPSGLAEIRDHVEKLLRNPELLTKHLGNPVPYTE